MIDGMGPAMEAWYAMVNGISVSVFKEDVPENHAGNYVLLRAEGETYSGNKRSFATEAVAVVEIVTKFNNNVDRSVASGIYGEVAAKIFPAVPSTSGLSNATGLSFENVELSSTTYLNEDDGVNKYYRIVCRYHYRILQTA